MMFQCLNYQICFSTHGYAVYLNYIGICAEGTIRKKLAGIRRIQGRHIQSYYIPFQLSEPYGNISFRGFIPLFARSGVFIRDTE